MELIQLDPPRSVEDFATALQQLLPIGEYWQPQEISQELMQVLEGIAIEFKIVHDDTKLTVLFNNLNNTLGWTLADYQSILDQTKPIFFDENIITIGTDENHNTVYDNQNYPNIIFILLKNTSDFLAQMQQLENHRLPHTQLAFNIVCGLNINAVARCINYARLETQET